MKQDLNTYFINGREVTRQRYIDCECAAGFFPKTPGNPATASFTKGGVSGYIKYG